VNIGSKVALTGQGGTSGYAASKGAILGLTLEWAQETVKLWHPRKRDSARQVMTHPQYEEWLKKFPDPAEKLRSVRLEDTGLTQVDITQAKSHRGHFLALSESAMHHWTNPFCRRWVCYLESRSVSKSRYSDRGLRRWRARGAEKRKGVSMETQLSTGVRSAALHNSQAVSQGNSYDGT